MQHIGHIDAARWIYTSSKHPLQPFQEDIIQNIIEVSYLNIQKKMEQITENNIRTCGFCHRELSTEAFYINKHTLHVDSYCKECRRSVTAERYSNSKSVNSSHSYPIITRTADPKLRMALIAHALQTVNESIARKQQRLLEEQNKLNKPATDRAD